MNLSKEFSNKKKQEEIKNYIEKGAIVLDVRTLEEWNEGHSERAEHIVLNTIPKEIDKIKIWNKPIVTVCRSGNRSGQATKFLLNKGFDVINGGSWQNVDKFL